jgi:ribosomal-protein-alanine acetyltransferase
VKVRLAVVADVPSMIAIEHASPQAAHWSADQYLELFRPTAAGSERFVLVAEDSPFTELPRDTDFKIAGFLVARHLAPEWELENIVVAPAARRQGIGRQLLEALLTHAGETNGASVFLEVRESNIAARNLYENLDFQPIGRRAAYYANPSEDAILYRTNLPQMG